LNFIALAGKKKRRKKKIYFQTHPSRMFRESSSKYKGKRRTRRMPVGIDEDDEIPEVYHEMLAEADARAATQEPILGQPLKRRRVGERVTIIQDNGPKSPEDGTTGLIGTLSKPIQMAIDSDVSDDSDMEWEEVDIEPRQFAEPRPSSHEEKDEVLQINFDQETTAPRKHVIARRKPLSVAEKKFRLDIHKFHLLCLLGHVQIRNHWCNDDEVQVRDLYASKSVS
jgi:xeroderma pigmentosum group C-complementing protein